MKYCLLIFKILTGLSLGVTVFFFGLALLYFNEPSTHIAGIGEVGSFGAAAFGFLFNIFGILSIIFVFALLITVLVLKKKGYEQESLRARKLIFDILIYAILTFVPGVVYYFTQK